MKTLHLFTFFLLVLFAPLVHGQEAEPKVKMHVQDDPADFFRFSYSDQWKVTRGRGYLELRGKKGDLRTVGIRVYALGLRSLGGKFRNLEHVVDDMIFQVRDEFKGKVSKKSTVKMGKDQKINARHVTGSQPSKNGRTKVAFYATEHPTQKGVIISFSFSGPTKAFDQYLPEAMKVLETLEIKEPKAVAPELPTMKKYTNGKTKHSFEVPEKDWAVKLEAQQSVITAPEGVMTYVKWADWPKGKNQKQVLADFKSRVMGQKIPMKVFFEESAQYTKVKPELPMTILFFEPDRIKMQHQGFGKKNLPTNTEMLLLIFDQANQKIHEVHVVAPNRLSFNRATPALKNLTHSLRLR